MEGGMLNLRRWIKRLWIRYFPSIVWRRQQVEVGIAFDLNNVDRKDLFEIERLLSKNGIHFDTGAGCGKRNWEWDFSLQGPIEVRFKRKR